MIPKALRELAVALPGWTTTYDAGARVFRARHPNHGLAEMAGAGVSVEATEPAVLVSRVRALPDPLRGGIT